MLVEADTGSPPTEMQRAAWYGNTELEYACVYCGQVLFAGVNRWTQRVLDVDAKKYINRPIKVHECLGTLLTREPDHAR